ncbi:MAG: glutathione reductase [Rhodospirillaceae bacterium]|nr:glutathione reductase [Rhodospirillaceae bacterium]
MARYDYDLFVIGAGSGGVRAARVAAGYGAKVAIAEEYRIGGTCVIRGCVPKKLLVYAAHAREEIEDAAGYGWIVGDARFDWPTLIANKDREIARLESIYRKLLAGSNVALIESRARLLDPHTIDIDGRQITADKILIATGAQPIRLPGYDTENSITSNEAFDLERLPRRVAVVGGGYIAVEFAGIFHGLGSQVSLLYRGEQILRGFDDDLRQALAAELLRKGIDLRLHSVVHRIDRVGQAFRLTLGDGSTLEVDQVMAAMGRRPNTADLGLDAAGVTVAHHGAVEVDAFSQTSQPNIYAIGDVTDRLNLTPVAIREAMAFADTVFGGRPWAMDYETVATAVFSQPPIGTIGLTESEARRRFGAIDVYKAAFRPMKHTLTGREERTLMKLVVERGNQRVRGAHMLGPDAPEIIQAMAIAVKMGATKQQFDEAVAIHPTAAEEFVTMRTREPDPVSDSLDVRATG